MSKAARMQSRSQRPARPSGAERRRVEAQRHKRNRWLFGGTLAVIVALAGTLIGLHVASGSASATGSSAAAASLPVGTSAPSAPFSTLAGKTETVAALRGKPTLVWFVTTWCTTCQAGTQTMAQNIATLSSDGVRVIEVENYADLGQSGPSIGTFAKSLAGSEFSNPDWTFGEASSSLTHTYNPKPYLDIYYLINAKGKITYVNNSPSSTMPQLLSAVKALA